MAGQMDSSGNVAYADNPFATNLNEFNRGVRQMLLMQRKWLIEQGSKSKGQQRSRVTETSRLPGDNMPEIDLSRRCFLKQDTR